MKLSERGNVGTLSVRFKMPNAILVGAGSLPDPPRVLDVIVTGAIGEGERSIAVTPLNSMPVPSRVRKLTRQAVATRVAIVVSLAVVIVPRWLLNHKHSSTSFPFTVERMRSSATSCIGAVLDTAEALQEARHARYRPRPVRRRR